MGKIQRIVVDDKVPQILEFRSGIIPSISYDYSTEPRVTRGVPFGTRLVNSRINGDGISSAIGYGQGAFFLLGNRDESRLGNSYLGFIDSFKRYSLSKLDEDVVLRDSFFLNVYDSRANCKKRLKEHLLLKCASAGGFVSVYELEFGKTELGERKFWENDYNLLWFKSLDSHLLVGQDGQVFDSNGDALDRSDY